MNIEAELPENFEDLSSEEKIDRLEQLKDRIDNSTDSGALKKRMLEELIREYSS